MTHYANINLFKWDPTQRVLSSSFSMLGIHGHNYPVTINVAGNKGTVQYFFDAERRRYKFDKVVSRASVQFDFSKIVDIELDIYRN